MSEWTAISGYGVEVDMRSKIDIKVLGKGLLDEVIKTLCVQ